MITFKQTFCRRVILVVSILAFVGGVPLASFAEISRRAPTLNLLSPRQNEQAAIAKLTAEEDATYVGGVSGSALLTNPVSSAAFRATRRGGYYFHYSILDPLSGISTAQLAQIAAVFRGLPQMAELGQFHRGFFSQEWPAFVLAPGFKPTTALVNIPAGSIGDGELSADQVAAFEAFAAEGAAAGLNMIAPIITPNSYPLISHPFGDSFWNEARETAVAGKGIGFDTPPEFFLRELQPAANGQAYRLWVANAIIWARSVNIRSTVILSPRNDTGTFLEDAVSELAWLSRANALPNNWVIENYSWNDPVPVGDDLHPEEVAGVAAWFATHAATAPWPSFARGEIIGDNFVERINAIPVITYTRN